jgi:hypothetical protein
MLGKYAGCGVNALVNKHFFPAGGFLQAVCSSWATLTPKQWKYTFRERGKKNGKWLTMPGKAKNPLDIFQDRYYFWYILSCIPNMFH